MIITVTMMVVLPPSSATSATIVRGSVLLGGSDGFGGAGIGVGFLGCIVLYGSGSGCSLGIF